MSGHFVQPQVDSLVVPAKAGTHDHRPVVMGPGSLPAFAGVGRDDGLD
jgi:hypothetical protein